MLKSMTGYGRCEELSDGKKITCEIKSVNHRYSDYNIKVPRYCGFMEDRVRKFISEYITRGKVDIYISIQNFEDTNETVHLNAQLAKNYIEELYKLRDEFGLRDDISVSTVARYNDIFMTEKIEQDEDALWEQVQKVLRSAAEQFVLMREREGERIEKDLCQRIEYMKTLTEKIRVRSPQTVAEYRQRLYEKIKEVLEDRNVDEARILTETAIFADKVCIDEENVRLNSHFNEFYNIISKNEPAGRKLDFLIQEINREVNTTGSKANDIEIAKLVVELKGETEKLREQIQNIE